MYSLHDKATEKKDFCFCFLLIEETFPLQWSTVNSFYLPVGDGLKEAPEKRLWEGSSLSAPASRF